MFRFICGVVIYRANFGLAPALKSGFCEFRVIGYVFWGIRNTVDDHAIGECDRNCIGNHFSEKSALSSFVFDAAFADWKCFAIIAVFACFYAFRCLTVGFLKNDIIK